jgi:PilZ domain
MQAHPFPALQPRSQCRFELRSLTSVTLDQSNRGVVRNLSHEGVMVRVLAPLHSGQRVKLSFDLRLPRLRVEAEGQVRWTNSLGACGIRFVGLSEDSRRRIDEWIFSNLLQSREAANRPVFGSPVVPISPQQDGNLIISGAPRPPIRMPPSSVAPAEPISTAPGRPNLAVAKSARAELSWLSRPLSARTLAWMVHGLVFAAGLLLFALIFLAIVHELPRWQLTLAASLAAAVFVAGTYWALFAAFGGASFGARVAGDHSGAEAKKRRR